MSNKLQPQFSDDLYSVARQNFNVYYDFTELTWGHFFESYSRWFNGIIYNKIYNYFHNGL